MKRGSIIRLGLPLVCGGLTLAALLQNAPAAPQAAAQIAGSPAALAQTLIAPASAEVAPQTIVSFALSTTATDVLSGALLPVTRWVEVTNQSDQDATVADDDATLTISVPEGDIAVPDAACTPIDGDPSSVACPHAFGPGLAGDFRVAFTAVPADGAAPLPQTMSVPRGGSVAIIADEGLTEAAVVLSYGSDARPQSLPSIDATWNGASVQLVAADTAALLSCSPQTPTPVATCATPNGRSLLLHINGYVPYGGPGPGIRFPSPPPQPQTSLNGPYIGVAGAPIELTGNATVCCDDAITGEVWSFGDGALASGDDVTHTYAQPGLYIVSLRTSTTYAYRDDATTAIAFPADTTPALLNTVRQPGSVQLPLGSAVTFDLRPAVPASPIASLQTATLIANLSEQTATVADDGSLVRVQVPDGYALQLLPLGGDAEQHCQYGNEPRPTPAPPPTRTANSAFPLTPPAPAPPTPLIATNDTHAAYALCPAGVHALAFTTVALGGG